MHRLSAGSPRASRRHPYRRAAASPALAPWAAVLVVIVALVLGACGPTAQRTPLEIGPDETESFDPNIGAPFETASLSVEGPAVATVDGVGISRQAWADRVQLIRFRYDRERERLRKAVDAGTVTQSDAQDQLLELAANAADAESVAVDDLVDLALKAKLASDEHISITPADVDAAQAAETKDDPTFLADLAKAISPDAYHRMLEAETLAAKLRDEIVRRATAESVDQVRLSEIMLQEVDVAEGATDVGAVHASQILYAPGDDPENAAGLETDDPAWAQAQAAAQATADALRAIADPVARAARFGELARTESDDVDTADVDGDLGWLTPDQLEVPMSDALFDGTHPADDVIGPVATEFGSSVLLYVERRPPLAQRVAAIQQQLAQPGADFSAIARKESDGAEASEGGDLGWVVPFEADPVLQDALQGATAGKVIGPLTQDDGVHFYRVDARETRSLSPDQHDSLQETAFDTWFDARREAAFSAGRIKYADDAP